MPLGDLGVERVRVFHPSVETAVVLDADTLGKSADGLASVTAVLNKGTEVDNVPALPCGEIIPPLVVADEGRFVPRSAADGRDTPISGAGDRQSLGLTEIYARYALFDELSINHR